MKKGKIKIIIVLIVMLIISSVSLSCMYKLIKPQNTYTIEEYEDIEYPSNYAFYLDGNFTKSTTWPLRSLYKYNATASYCSDGSKIKYDGIINKVDIEAQGTTKCYLYFDSYASMNKTTISQHVKSLATEVNLTGNQVNYMGAAYRYRGDNPDNYICVGTTDKTECLANPSLYLNRIVLAEEVEYSTTQDDETDGKDLAVKVIGQRNDELVNRTNRNWRSSNLYDYLSKEYSEDSMYNKRVINAGNNATFNDIILRTKIYSDYYGATYAAKSTIRLYSSERTDEDFAFYENMGLIYPSDFGFSAVTNDSSVTNINYCQNLELNSTSMSSKCVSWLTDDVPYHTILSGSTSTITFKIHNSGKLLYANSTVASNESYKLAYVRPVFYLQPDTYIVGGNGTASNPYMVNYEPDNNFESIAKNYLFKSSITGIKSYVDAYSQQIPCFDNKKKNNSTGACTDINVSSRMIGIFNTDYMYQPNLASGNTTWVEGNDYLLKLQFKYAENGSIINNNFNDTINSLNVTNHFTNGNITIPYNVVKAKWDVTNITKQELGNIAYMNFGFYDRYKIAYSFYNYFGLLKYSELISYAYPNDYSMFDASIFNNETLTFITDSKDEISYLIQMDLPSSQKCVFLNQNNNVFSSYSKDFDTDASLYDDLFITYPDNTMDLTFIPAFYIKNSFAYGIGMPGNPYRPKEIS